MLAIVASTVCAAAAGVATKRHGAALHPAALNAPAMLIGGGRARRRLARRGRWTAAVPRDASTWAAIGYLAIAGSVITFLGYFTLLKTWTVTSLSFISVFTPAIALILGFVFLDERPTIWNGVGGCVDSRRGGAGASKSNGHKRQVQLPSTQLAKLRSLLEVGTWQLGVDLLLLPRRAARRRSAEEQTRCRRRARSSGRPPFSPPSFALIALDRELGPDRHGVLRDTHANQLIRTAAFDQPRR